MAALAVSGGCILEPGKWAAFSDVQQKVKDFGAVLTSAVELVKATKAKYEAVVAQVKSGELSGPDVADTITGALADYQAARDKADQVRTKFLAAKSELEDFQREHETPWWQIILGLGLTAATGGTGLGWLKAGGRLGKALNGLRALYGAVEKAEDRAKAKNGKTASGADVIAEIKGSMARVKCPELEAIHRQRELGNAQD